MSDDLRQYGRLAIEKTRVVTQPNVIKAFAAMFLQEAHRTTRNYSALKDKVAKEIFGKGHRMEPYYTAAFEVFTSLNTCFRNGKLNRSTNLLDSTFFSQFAFLGIQRRCPAL